MNYGPAFLSGKNDCRVIIENNLTIRQWKEIKTLRAPLNVNNPSIVPLRDTRRLGLKAIR